MFAHVCMNTVQVLEESYVTKLVQFVMSDRLNSHIFAEIIQVCFGCCYCCDTGTRETDLGCGSKFVNNVRVACFCTFFQDLKKEILFLFFIIKMMYAVSIVPVDTEIRCCRFQACKALNCFF